MNTVLNDAFNIEAKKCKCGKLMVKMPDKRDPTIKLIDGEWYCPCTVKVDPGVIYLFWKVVNKKAKKPYKGKKKGKKNEVTSSK